MFDVGRSAAEPQQIVRDKMKTGKTQLTVMLLICSVLLPMCSQAWEPNGKDLVVAIKEGDLQEHAGKISAWLKQQVPAEAAQITPAAMSALLNNPQFVDALAERQFINKAWGMEQYAKSEASKAEFVSWVMSDAKLLNKVLLARTPTAGFIRDDNSWSIEARYIDIWKRIYTTYPESREGLYLKLAIATMLRPPGSANQGAGQAKKPVDPVERFSHFMKAHQAGDLMPSFDTLSIWELTHVVSSSATDKDLQWGRDTVNAFFPWSRDGEKVVTLTSQMKYQGSQIPYNDMSCLLAGGGKCGPRSSFGVFINQAFGIPAIGVGQPAHAAVSYRDVGGNWQVAYGRGWNVSKISDRYRMSGPDFLERVKERDRKTFAQVEHLRWLAETTTDDALDGAVMAAAREIAKAGKNIIDTTPFEEQPDERSMLSTFETPKDVEDHYNTRVRGYVYPPTSGEYVFSVAADDMADLFLSADENPDKKVMIAHLRAWAEVDNFTKYPTQTSQPVSLEAGKKYYIEAVHRENGGGDHLAVAWSGPGMEQGAIPGSRLSAYPSGGKGTIAREVWRDTTAKVASAKVKEKPEAAIKVPRGVIHVEAEDFFTEGGMGGFGYPGVPKMNCYDGGQQIAFGAMMQAAWVGYKINVPETGVYELTANASVINWHQKLYVRSFGAMYPVKSTRASDVYRAQHDGLGAPLATDGNMGTRWAMNFGKEDGWLELDLGEPRKISKVMIEERSLNRVSRFQVEYKDGEEWKTWFEGKTIENFKKELPPITAQFVRLHTFDTNSQTGGPSIWEFSVGDEFDGSTWITTEWKGAGSGVWQTTEPTEIRLVKGEQTIWLCAPSQRGLSLRWFQLKPKSDKLAAR